VHLIEKFGSMIDKKVQDRMTGLELRFNTKSLTSICLSL
jgi:hypothetical protein